MKHQKRQIGPLLLVTLTLLTLAGCTKKEDPIAVGSEPLSIGDNLTYLGDMPGSKYISPLAADKKKLVEVLEKASEETLPEGWEFDGTASSEYTRLTVISCVGTVAQGMHLVFEYGAGYKEPMVEFTERERQYAETFFVGKLLFPTVADADLPERLKYSGKTLPPLLQDLMRGKKFGIIFPGGGMRFRLEVDVKKIDGVLVYTATGKPRPMTLQREAGEIYPLSKIDRNTYIHGSREEMKDMDSERKTETLVLKAKEKREAELVSDGVDIEKEHNRVGEIYNRQTPAEFWESMRLNDDSWK